MKSTNRTFAIEGVAYWAKIQKPDEELNPPKYRLDLSVNEDGKALLASMGIKTKNVGDEKGDYIQPWKYAFTKDGKATPLKVIDGNMQPFKELIANGSKVIVEFYPKDWEMGGRRGVRPALTTVQVIEYIPYNPSPLKPVGETVTITLTKDANGEASFKAKKEKFQSSKGGVKEVV